MEEEMIGDLSGEDQDNLGIVLFVKALASLLKDDEGVIIHQDEKAYAVFKNSVEGTISVIEDDDYLEIEDGTLMWMHYDGSAAPEPGFNDDIIGADVTKH